MTKETLINLLLDNFYEDFAGRMTTLVIGNNSAELIYFLATNNDLELSAVEKKKVIFRAAYILETIYFNYPASFAPFVERFCSDFILCTNESAKRHFSKIMAHLLTYHTPPKALCEKIAEKSAEWAIEPRVRVAVRIWAINVLLRLKNHVEWVDEILLEIFEVSERNATPAMLVNLVRIKKQLKNKPKTIGIY